MGRGARSATFDVAMSPKKTGARSARARTRGQNPLVKLDLPVTSGTGNLMHSLQPSPLPTTYPIQPGVTLFSKLNKEVPVRQSSCFYYHLPR